MTDGVSINTNPAPAINHNVLMEILGASESVQARIVAFQKAKTEAETALAALKLGSDAKQAYADADAKYLETVAIQDKAKRDADLALSALADAKKQAADMIAEANALRDKAQADYTKAKADADAVLANATAEAAAKQKALDAALASVEADKAAARKATSEAQQMALDAKQAQDQAAAAEAEFKDKAAKLKEALGHVTSAS